MNKPSAHQIRRTWLTAITITFCFGALYNPAFSRESGPCAEDIAKFCKDVKPGKGGIAKCLKQHEGELSGGCKDSLSARKQKAQEFSQACKNDAAQYCKDTKPGDGKMLKCLKQNEGSLSAECKEALRPKK